MRVVVALLNVLKVATIGEPPTLDIPMSTAMQVFEIMWHVNEGLFTYDRNWNPIPHLAESYTLTDGARRYTIALRRGVRIHNGREMELGDYFTLDAARRELRGEFRTAPRMYFWNTWLNR